MITVDVVSKLTGKIQRRYLCKSMKAVKRLKRKYRCKLWVKLNIDDYDVIGR